MHRYTFSGHSDDIVEVKNTGEGTEDESDKLHFLLTASDGSKAYVYARYDNCWCFALGLAEEGTPLPDMTIETHQYHDYSMQLRLTSTYPLKIEEVDGDGRVLDV